MRKAILLQLLIFVSGLFPNLGLSQTFTVKEVAVFEINSAITPATLDYLKSNFKKVSADALILIKINTPGGLVTTTKDIITLIGTQNNPVAIWITPEGASASSAGAIIAASAHFILMSPGTNIGAATPVGLGEDLKESDGRSKALNDLSALVRAQAQSRGRPAAPFEDMIRTAKSFTDKEALEQKIIDGIVSEQKEVLPLLAGRSFTMKGTTLQLRSDSATVLNEYTPTTGQSLLAILANPSTAYFLFLIGVALVYFELQAPGGYIAGGIGSTFLILAAVSFQVLPLDLGALALLFVGIILLVLEIYVTSYGLLAVGGLAAFLAGSLFLFHGEGGFMSVDYPVIISTLLGIFAASFVIVYYVLRENKKIPKSTIHVEANQRGTVMTLGGQASAPYEYQVKVQGEIWKALSDELLQIGERIIVTEVNSEQLKLKIKRVK